MFWWAGFQGSISNDYAKTQKLYKFTVQFTANKNRTTSRVLLIIKLIDSWENILSKFILFFIFFKTKRLQDWEIDYFEKTVPMSTYLVAFVVSNFKRIIKYSPKYNIEIQVVARPDAIKNNEGEYALHEAAEIIDYFVDYFNVSYSLNHSGKLIAH